MAEASGLLHEGDEILEVNEVDLRGKNVNEVKLSIVVQIKTLYYCILIQTKISYNEIRELKKLPNQIEKKEASIEKIHEKMSEAGFYQKDKEHIIEIVCESIQDDT